MAGALYSLNPWRLSGYWSVQMTSLEIQSIHILH